MNFSNPYSRDLGVFTWPELQAAYPNGGGGLAAISAGVIATVTDICKAVITVTPNAAKTRWIPRNGHAVMFRYGSTLGTPLHTWSGATGKASIAGGDPQIAAGALATGDVLLNSFYLRKRNANATAAIALRLGTTGNYLTDSVVINDTISNVDNRQMRAYTEISFGSATSFFTTAWNAPSSQNTSPGSDKTTNVNTAAAMYAVMEVSSINASDFVDLIYWRLEWFAQ